MSEWIRVGNLLPKIKLPVKLKWVDAGNMNGGEAYGRLKIKKTKEFQCLNKNGNYRNSFVYTPDYWKDTTLDTLHNGVIDESN